MTGAALEAPPPATPAPERVDSRRSRSWSDRLRRPVVASLVLLVAYASLTLVLNDPRGTLGTDTGGKLATMHVMEHNGGLDPDVGYWAAAADPKGELHPLFYTFQVDGKWVNATTLPMLYAAYPLFLVGGDRAVLLLPMLGALLCALAARALARRLGARTGWAAFWVVGLATPVAIYALDFWEHALGLGLMLSGFVAFYDVAERRAGWRRALVGGLLFGAAATMRTEALIYFAVAGLGACVVTLARRRSLLDAFTRGVAMLGGLAVPLVLNQVLEYATVGGSMRAGRATSTANAAGTGLSTRVREAFTTTLGLNRFELNLDIVLGGIIVALIVYGAWRLTREDAPDPLLGVAVIGVAALFLVLRFTEGLGFLSGLLTASPIAAVGVLLGWRRATRFPLLVGALALPLVWAFQYSGGAGPQWGGRYEIDVGRAVRHRRDHVARGSAYGDDRPGGGLGARHRVRAGVVVAAIEHRRRRHRSFGGAARPGGDLRRGPRAARGRCVLRAGAPLVDRDHARRTRACGVCAHDGSGTRNLHWWQAMRPSTHPRSVGSRSVARRTSCSSVRTSTSTS